MKLEVLGNIFPSRLYLDRDVKGIEESSSSSLPKEAKRQNKARQESKGLQDYGECCAVSESCSAT